MRHAILVTEPVVALLVLAALAPLLSHDTSTHTRERNRT